jgi:ankyrin repeat protein
MLLVSKGASVSVWDPSGRAPLYYAALLEAGAAPNAVSAGADTALHAAAAGNHAGVATLLLKHGAAVDAMDDSCRTPLHIAVAAGCAAIAEVLLHEGAAPNTPTTDAKTALHLAAQHKQPVLLQMLLDAGADVSAQDVLSCASTRGSRQRLQCMLGTAAGSSCAS